MKVLLDSIEPYINYEKPGRKEFLFLLVQSGNKLFYHEYPTALQHGEKALGLENHSK